MCTSYLCEVAVLHMTFATYGQSETTSLLVFSLIRVRLRTSNPSNPTLGGSHLMALGNGMLMSGVYLKSAHIMLIFFSICLHTFFFSIYIICACGAQKNVQEEVSKVTYLLNYLHPWKTWEQELSIDMKVGKKKVFEPILHLT